MAVRWMEYKYKVHFRVFEINAPRRNLDESTVSETGMGPWVCNLLHGPGGAGQYRPHALRVGHPLP
jgi:hypothetical protein